MAPRGIRQLLIMKSNWNPIILSSSGRTLASSWRPCVSCGTPVETIKVEISSLQQIFLVSVTCHLLDFLLVVTSGSWELEWQKLNMVILMWCVPVWARFSSPPTAPSAPPGERSDRTDSDPLMEEREGSDHTHKNTLLKKQNNDSIQLKICLRNQIAQWRPEVRSRRCKEGNHYTKHLLILPVSLLSSGRKKKNRSVFEGVSSLWTETQTFRWDLTTGLYSSALLQWHHMTS